MKWIFPSCSFQGVSRLKFVQQLYHRGVVDTSDKLLAGVIDTGDKLIYLGQGVVAEWHRVHNLSPITTTLWISLRIFLKVWNGPNRILEGPGGTWLRKKNWRKSHVELPLKLNADEMAQKTKNIFYNMS